MALEGNRFPAARTTTDQADNRADDRVHSPHERNADRATLPGPAAPQSGIAASTSIASNASDSCQPR
jgi:hypothetical protein